MRRSDLSKAMLLLLVLPSANLAQAQGTQSAPVAASGNKPTLQEQFNQASQAADGGDCATAMPIFDRLIVDPRVKPGTLPAAAIAVRRGHCLYLDKRFDESEAQIQIGLPLLAKAGSEFAIDIGRAEQTLAAMATARWDRDAAVIHLKAGLAQLRGKDRLPGLLRLSQALSFDGTAEPLTYIDEGLAILNAEAKPDKDDLAAFYTVRGRILMNQGRDDDAYTTLKKALTLSGGLTSRVNLQQVTLRSDLAQAALLNRNKDQARLYLAYTGAGRIAESPFATAASMAPPQCGPETGLSPQDSAIVEFSIDDKGDVSSAQTIYTRGNYAVASAFARAVSAWYWLPEDIAKIPAFYKLLTRIELRCSNSGASLPDITTPLKVRFMQWAAPLLTGIDIEDAKIGANLEALSGFAASQEADGKLPAAVAGLTARAMYDPRPTLAVLAGFDKAMALAGQAALPAETVNAIRALRTASAFGLRDYTRGAGRRDASAAPVLAAAQEQSIAADPLAQDTLLLLAVRSSKGDTEKGDATSILMRVANDDRLAERHPLRQVALLQLANMAAGAGDLGAAHAYFERTGLTEEQCSLIGPKPIMRSTGASSGDYPMAALSMGFEGWVNMEYDIQADGRTANARPVIAYPPFVFIEAASGIAGDVRYQTSYRPSGGAACSAERQTVNFRIPH